MAHMFLQIRVVLLLQVDIPPGTRRCFHLSSITLKRALHHSFIVMRLMDETAVRKALRRNKLCTDFINSASYQVYVSYKHYLDHVYAA